MILPIVNLFSQFSADELMPIRLENKINSINYLYYIQLFRYADIPTCRDSIPGGGSFDIMSVFEHTVCLQFPSSWGLWRAWPVTGSQTGESVRWDTFVQYVNQIYFLFYLACPEMCMVAYDSSLHRVEPF